MLTLRGSNTVGLELAPRIAQAYLAYNGASEVSILRSKDDRDEATIVGSRGGKQEAIVVSAHGSGFAAKGLAAHSDAAPTDIGMTSRRMTQLERELLMPKGDMYNPTSEHVLALDGVAVIVNPANTIGVLSVQQIKDVFAGTIVDWGDKRLGGTPGPIALYARDANSGTFDTFSSLALRGAKLRSDAQRFEDSEALSAAVSKDPNGIGFIGLPYVATNKAIAVSDGGASPVRPNRLTVATEGYAFARRLFLYTAPGNANPDTHRFVEFALSQAGQKLVEQVGFVALTLQAESVKLAPGTPPEYEAMIRNAERLSTDFRFRFNSVDLDNRSVRDTTRLADYLASRRIDPRRLLLVGFGDNIGQPAAIKAVSENRARAVAAALRQDGIAVGQTAGFGALMLVADNSTDEGRDKNRRVEVFLRP
ncbi:MAG: substrate-binding domain-containing protein [Rhodospirillales bacterium]